MQNIQDYSPESLKTLSLGTRVLIDYKGDQLSAKISGNSPDYEGVYVKFPYQSNYKVPIQYVELYFKPNPAPNKLGKYRTTTKQERIQVFNNNKGAIALLIPLIIGLLTVFFPQYAGLLHMISSFLGV